MISMLRWYYLINTSEDVAAKQSVHLAEYIYFVWVVDTRATFDVFRDTLLKCMKRSQEQGFPRVCPDYSRHSRGREQPECIRPPAAAALQRPSRH